MSIEWNGCTKSRTLNNEYVAARTALADAARNYQWEKVFEIGKDFRNEWSDPSHLQEFTQTELASNVLSTLLRTTVSECKDVTFTELYEDCARDPSNPRITCTDGSTSCVYIGYTTKRIIW